MTAPLPRRELVRRARLIADALDAATESDAEAELAAMELLRQLADAIDQVDRAPN
jgi:hypothetical protein